MELKYLVYVFVGVFLTGSAGLYALSGSNTISPAAAMQVCSAKAQGIDPSQRPAFFEVCVNNMTTASR
jgi:hypothetical protein